LTLLVTRIKIEGYVDYKKYFSFIFMSVTTPLNPDGLSCKEDTMRYRSLGKTGLKISALSMGCMRLGEDMALNEKVVARAIELGVNYFETTRRYCDGKCQHRVAPGIKDRTAGIIVSGKEGINPNKSAYLFRKEIEHQLDILNLTHFRFFQVGWFSWEMFPHLIKRGGVMDAIRRAQDEGLIQRIGFTGHDSPENFIKCVETGLFDCITVPYNLVNRKYEPTIKRAGELGVGVVAMCPIAGGILSSEAAPIKDAFGVDMPTTAMALRFVLSNPDVSSACSGMSTIEMVEQNVRIVKEFNPAVDADFGKMCEGLDKLRAGLGNRACTSCRYCVPCPKNIDIPRHMELYRNLKCFGLVSWVKKELDSIKMEERFVNCSDCGVCESKCPNGIDIRETIKELLNF